jgi:hypothetical protein
MVNPEHDTEEKIAKSLRTDKKLQLQHHPQNLYSGKLPARVPSKKLRQNKATPSSSNTRPLRRVLQSPTP